MKTITIAGIASVILLSAGAAFAAEGCGCCKDMAANAEMTCCDKMETPTAPAEPPAPPPPAPTPAEPSHQGHAGHD